MQPETGLFNQITGKPIITYQAYVNIIVECATVITREWRRLVRKILKKRAAKVLVHWAIPPLGTPAVSNY